jgi:hypothetical protein
MIYKLTFEDDRIDWCTAKDQLHLLKSYDADFYLDIQDIKSIEEIPDEEAKTVMVKNSEFDENNSEEFPEEISLYDLSVGEDFAFLASNEYDW